MPVQIRSPGRGPNGPAPIDARRPISGGLGVGVWQPPVPATLTTIRYVRKTGSDSNGGTSPADAWLTINKALTTASPGTVIYVGAGVYRETVQVTITPTQSLPVAVVGDVDGAWTGDAGMVQLTAYTTNDKTLPSSTTLLDLNGKSNLTFQNLMLVQGNASVVTSLTATSQYVVFRNCAVIPYVITPLAIFSVLTVYGAPFHWLIDSCSVPFCGSAGVFILNTPGSNTGNGDYDIDFAVRNCFFQSWAGVSAGFFLVNTLTVSTFKPGGFKMSNSIVIGAQSHNNSQNALSTVFPHRITNCVWVNPGGSGLVTNTTGQVVEDYNLIYAATPRSNVNAGPHSVSNGSYALLFHFGQERTWGGNLRPFGEPMASSPLNAFGNDGSQAPYDIRNGPRPTGILVPAIGPYERGNNFVKETGTVHTGTNAISVIGDGFADFDLPIDAGTRIISVYCRVDSNYSGPPPRLQVIPNGEIGVGDQADAGSSAGVGAFEQLSVQVAPTGSGIVTVRVISSDVSGIGKTIFDTFAVA